jgi:hypothetical protein
MKTFKDRIKNAVSCSFAQRTLIIKGIRLVGVIAAIADADRLYKGIIVKILKGDFTFSIAIGKI